MSLFRKDHRTPYQKEVDAIADQMKKDEDKALDRQMRIARCYTALKKCDRAFDDTISAECSTAIKLEQNGFVAETQRERIKQAAMGKIVAKRAEIELESVSTEEQLNSAINLLGTALRQMNRLSGFSTESVKSVNRRTIQDLLPDDEDKAIFDRILDTEEPIPQEITDRVNETFVNNLLDGMEFDECLRATKVPPRSAKAGETEMDRGKYNDIIRQHAAKK